MHSSRHFSRVLAFFLVFMLVSMSCQFLTRSISGVSGDNSTPGAQSGDVSQSTNHKLSLQGQLGGSSYAVDVQDTHAFLGVGPRVYVLDVSDSAAPKFLGQSPVMPGVVQSVLASGDYVYVADGDGYLRVLDVSDPTQPAEVASLREYSYAQGLALDGTTLYVADNAFGLRVVDMSDPRHPKKIGEAKIPGAASSIAIDGSRAFLAGSTAEHGLVAIDISNPAQPVQTAAIAIPDAEGSVVYAVQVRDNYAYVAAGSPGLVVVDISDPAQPVKVGQFQAAWADGLVIDGDTLYLADQIDGLYVLDISNPKKPAQVGLLSVELFQQSVPSQRNMVLQNGKIFLANGNQGMLVVEASAQPALAGKYDTPLPGADWHVRVDKNVAWVIADTLGLYAVDVADPSQPKQLGVATSRISSAARTPRGLAIAGQYAYIADINNGFSVYDVSDPAAPNELGRVEKPQGMTDVAVSGNYAYVSVEEHEKRERRGLLVFDVSEPSQPHQVGFVNTDHSSNALTVAGNYAYFPEFIEGIETGQPANLFVFDISNPPGAVEAGKADTGVNAPSAQSIQVAGKYAYVGDGQLGLRIFDISNPARPVEVGAVPEIRIVLDLAVAGDRVFTADHGYVSVVDVSNPSKPVLEDMYTSPGLSWGIDAVGNTVYIADFDGGLAILEYAK
jgi:hypothetical protein